jgi:hypothetical protein
VSLARFPFYKKCDDTIFDAHNHISCSFILEQGWSIQLSDSGRRLVYGCPGNADTDDGDVAGIIRLITESAGVWTQLGDTIVGEVTNFGVGSEVSISGAGATIAFFAGKVEVNTTNATRRSRRAQADTEAPSSVPSMVPAALDGGQVIVLNLNKGTWEQLGQIIQIPADPSVSYAITLARYGYSVAVGAVSAEDSGNVICFILRERPGTMSPPQ